MKAKTKVGVMFCFAVLIYSSVSILDFATAAVPSLKSELKKYNKFVERGILVGGEAQRDIIISEVRRTYSKAAKTERMIFELATASNKISRSGFYHIAVDQGQRRIVIDLEGVAASRVPLGSIEERFKKSPLVEDVSVTMDPADRSANITVVIKRSLPKFRVHAFELDPIKGKGQEFARLAIDIK